MIFPCKNAFKSVRLGPLKLLQPKNVLKSPEFSFLEAFRVKNDRKWAAQIKFEKFLKISRRLKGILSEFLLKIGFSRGSEPILMKNQFNSDFRGLGEEFSASG